MNTMRFKKSRAAIKYVNGYWQSPKFFSQIESQLQKELRVKTKPSKENEAMLQQIAQDNAVCVHIRRGDYIGSNFDICTEAIIKKQWKSLLQKSRIRFFISSLTLLKIFNGLKRITTLIIHLFM